MSELWISQAAIACPIGLSYETAGAAFAAGLTGFRQLPYHDEAGEPLAGAAVELLPWDLPFEARLESLLACAVQECLNKTPEFQPAQVPLFLGVSEDDRPVSAGALGQRLVHRLEKTLGFEFVHPRTCTLARGAVSTFQLLGKAAELIRTERLESVLVAAVDSSVNARALVHLHRQRRLKTALDSDGLIPGEAAACLWLTRARPKRAGHSIRVRGIGFGQEAATVLNDAPLRGEGLTQALKQALSSAGLGMADIDCRMVDASGESYAFKEQSLALSRLLRTRKERVELWHPAERIGDVGAAVGACLLVFAKHAFESNQVPGCHMACTTGTATGERAAVILSDDEGQG